MKARKQLPWFGVGPIDVYGIAALILAAVLMRDRPEFESGG